MGGRVTLNVHLKILRESENYILYAYTLYDYMYLDNILYYVFVYYQHNVYDNLRKIRICARGPYCFSCTYYIVLKKLGGIKLDARAGYGRRRSAILMRPSPTNARQHLIAAASSNIQSRVVFQYQCYLTQYYNVII